MRAQIVSRPQEDNQALALGNCFVCTATPLQAPCNLQPATWFRTSCFRARYPRSLVLFLSARPFHTQCFPFTSTLLRRVATNPNSTLDGRQLEKRDAREHLGALASRGSPQTLRPVCFNRFRAVHAAVPSFVVAVVLVIVPSFLEESHSERQTGRSCVLVERVFISLPGK